MRRNGLITHVACCQVQETHHKLFKYCLAGVESGEDEAALILIFLKSQESQLICITFISINPGIQQFAGDKCESCCVTPAGQG